MIAIRCRPLQLLEFLVIISVLWVFSMFLFWQVRGPCDIEPRITIQDGHQNTESLKVTSHVTPVYVIEEHHEALLYWFSGAEKGYVQKQGNVVLHIDGHVDGSPPSRQDVLPMFRWPNLRDIYNMMQRNDQFVVAAAFTGFLKRYIWVRPPWDVEKEVSMSPHVKVALDLGTTVMNHPNGTVVEEPCFCGTILSNDRVFPDGTCLRVVDRLTEVEEEVNDTDNVDDSDVNDELDGEDFLKNAPAMLLEKDKCNIRVRGALFEVVGEDKAIELMKSGTWITSLDSVVLDIDEDYYGVEPAVQPLLDSDFSEMKLDWVQRLVNNIFCVGLPEEEREADKYYAHLLDLVITFKQFCLFSENTTPNCTRQARSYLFNATLDQFLSEMDARNLRESLCHSRQSSLRHLHGLMRVFLQSTIPQLKALKEVGICFIISPRSLEFDRSLGMRTCDGYNRPNRTAVAFHTPSKEEVSFRTQRLKSMLNKSGLYPGIVTVCRSTRDGYTPRHMFRQIENDVMGVLKDVFPYIDDTVITYDSHLLGGKEGWYGRH